MSDWRYRVGILVHEDDYDQARAQYAQVTGNPVDATTNWRHLGNYYAVSTPCREATYENVLPVLKNSFTDSAYVILCDFRNEDHTPLRFYDWLADEGLPVSDPPVPM